MRLLIGFFALCSLLHAAPEREVEFRADFYQRDIQKNTLTCRGNAWVKKGTREIWADEILIDFTEKTAIANGKVHVKDEDDEIWATHVNYHLDSEEALLEQATLSSGQVVLSGATIHRLTRVRYEIEEGSYTNCNVLEQKFSTVGQCVYDWKIYGHKLSLTLEEYAHIQDALFYVKQMPVLYFPYFVVPIKTARQSGLLMPRWVYSATQGHGVGIPYYWAINRWSDLTIDPTYFEKRGLHLGLQYRYRYSAQTSGDINLFTLQRRFTDNLSDATSNDPDKYHLFGLFGEWAANIQNAVLLGERAHTRQQIRYVSNPKYTYDNAADLAPNADGSASLRSQLSLTLPFDRMLLAGHIQHHQPLIVSLDENQAIDRGGLTEIPRLFGSWTNSSFLHDLFSYELDTLFTHFDRIGPGYDRGPVNPDPSSYQAGNYVRSGTRFDIEPRLLMNVPMPVGFQFQPLVKVGAQAYHFDIPQSEIFHREYAEAELPVSMYLVKRFETGISGFEKVSHVFQPRFTYANRFAQSGEPNHPFFRDTLITNAGYSPPRFELSDYPEPFEYMRFELINRLLRSSDGNVQRFFRLQLSEQYNLKTSSIDPRFTKKLGPIEVLGEFQIWRLTGQLQAIQQLEATPQYDASGTTIIGNVVESDWSSSIAYNDPLGDMFRINTRLQTRVADSATDKIVGVAFLKRLPFFFDLEGSAGYSLKRGAILDYRLAFLFASKPRSCWELSFAAGRDMFLVPFANVSFRLNFGAPSLKSG